MRQISADHPVRVDATPDNPITLLNRGATFYYGQTSAVSSTNNDGSVVAGASLSLTVPTWVRSASQSFVDDLPTPANDTSRVSTPTFKTLASGAFVTSSIDIAIEHDVSTPMVFDTVIADNDHYFDSNHPTRLTVPRAGLYYLHGNIEFGHNIDGARLVQFRRNGRTSGFDPDSVDEGHGEIWYDSVEGPATTPQVHAQCATVLAAGDYVEMFGFTSFFGTPAVITTRHVRPNTPQFAIFYKGPAS